MCLHFRTLFGKKYYFRYYVVVILYSNQYSNYTYLTATKQFIVIMDINSADNESLRLVESFDDNPYQYKFMENIHFDFLEVDALHMYNMRL